MSNISPIPGNGDPILVMSATGLGAGTTTFIHNSAAEGNYAAQLYPAVFILAITDIVGVFSALAVNLEWSPITSTGTPQFQTVATWTPLVSPVAFFPCSSTGQYRLNTTAFTGGTSFNVYASIAASMPQGAGGSGGGGSVTQGTVPWIVAFSSAQHVIVDSGAGAGTQYADAAASGAHPTGTQLIGWNKGGSTELAITALGLTNAQALEVAIVDGNGNQITSFGGGTQFADNAASGATPTGTLSMGWDSANSKVRALKVDASQNLLVDVSNASIAVTGTFFQATQPVSIAASVAVTGTFFQVTQPVSIAANVGVTQQTTPWTDQGASASGAAKAGNPVQIGGVFNTTQPTVTTGQTVEGQSTARGALIVATGVDAFTVAVSGSVAVTGTFFQATQPVSIAASVAVTGTFFQATQPVSIAANVGVTQQTTPWLIQGNVADGSTTETNILVVGGESNDATAQYQPIPLGAAGRSVIIEGFSGGTAVPVSGTVAVTQSTSPWVVSLTSTTITGTVAVTQSTSPWVNNLTQVAGVVLGATSVVNYGSTPAAVAVSAVNAFVTNTVTITGTVTVGNATLAVTQSTNPWVVSGTVTANQGTANTLVNAWPHEITDGTNGPVAVKPASTAAIAADSALVVAISPNNPISLSISAIGTIGQIAPTTAIQIAGQNGNSLQAIKTDSLGQQVITDVGAVGDLLRQIVLETRALRYVLLAMDRTIDPSDFNPAQFADLDLAI